MTGIAETITGSNFTGSTSASFGAGVTVSNFTVVSDTSITVTIDIAAGATAGARNVQVTNLTGTGTGSGLFTVNTVTTLGAPAPINLGHMGVANSPVTASSTGTITTNGTSWQVTAKDQKASNPGFMNTSVDGTGTKLNNKLKIGKTASPSTDADQGITYSAGDTALPLYVSQTIVSGDTAGSYSIVITFTVSTP